MLWAFSRDGAVPFSNIWHQVRSVLHVNCLSRDLLVINVMHHHKPHSFQVELHFRCCRPMLATLKVQLQQHRIVDSVCPQVDQRTKIPRNAVWGMVLFALLLG